MYCIHGTKHDASGYGRRISAGGCRLCVVLRFRDGLLSCYSVGDPPSEGRSRVWKEINFNHYGHEEDDALQEAGGFGMFSSISGSLAKIIKDLQYQYLYIVPFISGTDAQEYFRANRALDNGGKYNAQPYRFPVLEAGNGLKYPVALNTTPINHTADVKAIETSIKTIVKDIDKKLKTLNKVTARTFVDIVGGNAINPRGHVYQIDGGKGIKLTTVLLIGSKQQLPASKMSTGYFDTESNCNNFINFCKNHYLLQSVNEKITANKNAVANAKNNQSGGTDEDRAQQMLTDAVEKFTEYEAKYVYVVSSSDDKLQDNTKSIIGTININTFFYKKLLFY